MSKNKDFHKPSSEEYTVPTKVNRLSEASGSKCLTSNKGKHDILSKVLTYADDSSEDESENKNTVYDLIDQISKFKEDNSVSAKPDTILSFIGHASGIALLYRGDVQIRYSELKQKSFKQDLQVLYNSLDNSRNKLKDMVGINHQERKTLETFIDGKIKSLPRNMQSLKSVENSTTKEIFEKYFYLPYPLNSHFEGFQRKTLKKNSSNSSKEKTFTSDEERVNFDLSDTESKDFVVEFLSHLRLHNRLDKRTSKNFLKCESEEFRQLVKILCKHITDNQLTKNSDYADKSFTFWKNLRSVNFNNNIGFKKMENEKQGKRPYEVTHRIEKVFFKEYPSSRNIKTTYENLFGEEEIEDFDKILQYRINIKKAGDGSTPSYKALCLWYLLFGCEVKRNPASLIHINMALDIAQENPNKTEIKKDVKNNIPMTIADIRIVESAMCLNEFFGKYMPINYQYNPRNHGIEDSKHVLIEREAEITKKWLELKKGKVYAKELIKKCATDDNTVKEIYGLIRGSYEEWRFI